MVDNAMNLAEQHEIDDPGAAFLATLEELGVCVFVIRTLLSRSRMNSNDVISSLKLSDYARFAYVDYNPHNNSHMGIHLSVMEELLKRPKTVCRNALVLGIKTRPSPYFSPNELLLIMAKFLQIPKPWDLLIPGFCMEPKCTKRTEVVLSSKSSYDIHTQSIGSGCSQVVLYSRRFSIAHLHLTNSLLFGDAGKNNNITSIAIDASSKSKYLSFRTTYCLFNFRAYRTIDSLFQAHRNFFNWHKIISSENYDALKWSKLNACEYILANCASMGVVNSMKRLLSPMKELFYGTQKDIIKDVQYFYINYDDDGKMRANFEDQLLKIGITAARVRPVLSPILKEQFFGIKLPSNSYSIKELTLTSTFKSICINYYKSMESDEDSNRNKNEDFIIIMEDNVILSDGALLRAINDLILYAPKNWGVIQFDVKNPQARIEIGAYLEPFVTWMPEYRGTSIIAVSALAAKKISSKDFGMHPVADFFMFYELNTFTHTRNLFGTISPSTKGLQTVKTSFLPTTKSSYNSDSFKCPYHRILAMTYSLGGKHLQRVVDDMHDTLPVGLDILILTTPSTGILENAMTVSIGQDGVYFSKWLAYASQVYRFKDYSKVLLFDDDESFAGFPWYTVFCRMKKAGDPIITGFPRESIRDNINEMHMLRGDSYMSTNADFWRSGAKFKEMYPLKTPVSLVVAASVQNLEQNAVLIDSDFASWFLHQLGSNQTGSDAKFTNALALFSKYSTDWGPDVMWCGAAKHYYQIQNDKKKHFNDVYGSGLDQCVSIPTPIWHHDLGTVSNHYDKSNKRTSEFKKRGFIVMDLLKTNKTFALWMKNANDDREIYSFSVPSPQPTPNPTQWPTPSPTVLPPTVAPKRQPIVRPAQITRTHEISTYTPTPKPTEKSVPQYTNAHSYRQVHDPTPFPIILRHVKDMIQNGLLDSKSTLCSTLRGLVRKRNGNVQVAFDASIEGKVYSEATFDNKFFLQEVEDIIADKNKNKDN